MPGRVVLHVGAMKSGTTYIQSRLFANKELLEERGVLLPGREWVSQVYAVKHLLRGSGRMWDKHAAKVSAHPGTSVISMEFLGPARPAMIRRVRETIMGEIEVVISARDLNRTISAMWQEDLQNGRTWRWPDYLADIEAFRPGHREAGAAVPEAGRAFWYRQNLVRIARNWGEVVGAENVTLLTVPHPGAPQELMWERFAAVLRTDPHGFAQASRANESLGAASALAVRRLNELLEESAGSLRDDDPVRKRLLAKRVLSARRLQESPIGLPVTPWVAEHSAEMVSGLQRLGVRLVGDWGDLTPVAVQGVEPTRVPEQQVTDAALAGVIGLMMEMKRVGHRVEE